MKDRIKALKQQKNAVILAHYYAPQEVQEIADYIGDSFFLAKKASGRIRRLEGLLNYLCSALRSTGVIKSATAPPIRAVNS